MPLHNLLIASREKLAGDLETPIQIDLSNYENCDYNYNYSLKFQNLETSEAKIFLIVNREV